MKSKILLSIAAIIATCPAWAEEAAQVAQAANKAGFSQFGLFAAGLGMGLAALGGALGQGRIASAALEGIGRNPQSGAVMQTQMILGLVFVETLVLLTFVISILIYSL